MCRGSTNWLNGANYGFYRGNGSIFTFNGNNNNVYNNSNYARAVAVCGAGLLYRFIIQESIMGMRGENFKEFSEDSTI